MNIQLHHKLWSRLELRGPLVMKTALHIGTGDNADNHDAVILRSVAGEVLIPGSSLKGVLRHRAESLAHLLNIDVCHLKQVKDGGRHSCLSTHKNGSERIQNASAGGDDELAAFVAKNLCLACRLFGGASWRSKVAFSDASMSMGESIVERRDGVGIDRDSRRASSQVLFGLEVVPAQTEFGFHLVAENLDETEKQLLAMALLELVNGHIGIGGKTSRGLGRVVLDGQRSTLLLSDFTKPADIRAFFSVAGAAPGELALTDWLETQCQKAIYRNEGGSEHV